MKHGVRLNTHFIRSQTECSQWAFYLKDGHDAQDVDGTRLMFGTLRNYLDEEFIQNHPMIKITRGGEVKEYELFAVKVTDTDDEAYRLDFDDGEFEEFADAMGAPANTVEILTLSTCLGNEDDLRLLVQGAITK